MTGRMRRMEKNVKFRNHFSMVIESLLSMWLVWLYLLISIFSDDAFEEKIGAIVICLAVILFILIINTLSWCKTTFVFDENAIVMEKNTLTKTIVTVSMSNIATVNINRSVLQAILGIRKVKIDTNSSSSTTSELEIYLSKKDAYAFQQTIMSYIKGEIEATGEDNIKEEVKSSSQASFDDIIFHCIYTLKIVEIVATVVAGAFFILTEAEIDEGESVGGVMGVITMVIAVVALVVSFLKSFFAYYKIEAARIQNELNVSYGFFDKKTFRIPINRIVAIKIKEPLIGRLFKKAYAEIVCVGMGDEEKELSLISLCTSKKLLATKLHTLLPEFIPEEISNADEFYIFKREDKKGMKVRLIKSVVGILYLVIGALILISIFGDDWSEIISIFGLIVLGFCLLILVYGICENRTSGYAVDSKYFRIANGAFNRDTFFVPYDKIEHMTINKSPVYKLFGLANIEVYIKSGGLLSVETLDTCYIDDKDIQLIKEMYKKSYVRS